MKGRYGTAPISDRATKTGSWPAALTPSLFACAYAKVQARGHHRRLAFEALETSCPPRSCLGRDSERLASALRASSAVRFRLFSTRGPCAKLKQISTMSLRQHRPQPLRSSDARAACPPENAAATGPSTPCLAVPRTKVFRQEVTSMPESSSNHRGSIVEE